MARDETDLTCTCGAVALQVRGRPIISRECLCTSCRAAAGRLGALPGARRLLTAYGATRFVLYRKDRVRFSAGREHLRAFRLTPEAGSRRVVASCCNAPVFLELDGGHWLSLYGHLWPEGALPPLQMRTMARDLPDPSRLPDDVPNRGGQSLGFFALLFGAWVAMGFRNPQIEVTGTVDA